MPLDGEGRLVVFSLGRAPHGPTVGSHHELIPVADPQERNTALEEILVRVRGDRCFYADEDGTLVSREDLLAAS